MKRRIFSLVLLCLFLMSFGLRRFPTGASQVNGASRQAISSSDDKIPAFDHVIWVVLENKNYEEVIGNPDMPYLNQLAKRYVLLDQYYAVQHPSLPNYIALVGGDTFRISKDCIDCFINEVNLADRIEASGRTWKAYQEDMPSACFLGNEGQYVQKHNPFIYFDSIRLDKVRCERSVVPLEVLGQDLKEKKLPNFALISPNLCHSGHDCTAEEVDRWLKQVLDPLLTSTGLGKNSLVVITFDEAKKENTDSCCGLGWRAGGKVATVMISPLARSGFVDSTRYSHYSLLKTILHAWQLPDLGATRDTRLQPITAPWN